MFDFLDKFNEDKQISEKLFDKIFGKKQNEPKTQVTPEPEIKVDAEPQDNSQQAERKPQKQPRLEFERGKVYEYDLTKIPILGKFSNPITYLSFKSPEEFKAFKAILYYLNAGFFDSDINNIKRAIKYHEIDGFGPFPYLSTLFNNNKGTTLQAAAKPIKEASKIKFNMPAKSTLRPKPIPQAQPANVEGYSAMDSMRRLEKFVKYFVENLVDVKGAPNKSLKNSIIIRLKKLIGTNVSSPKKTVEPNQGPIEPGAKPEDLNQDGEEAINFALKSLKEDIQQEIRKIIKDNF